MHSLPWLALALVAAASCAGDPARQAAGELERRGVAIDNRSLYRSLRQGDLEAVELLVAAGVRPKLALRRALEAGRCETLEVMLAAGYPRDDGVAAATLLLAQDRGLGDCVSALRRAGVTLDASFRGIVALAARLAAMDEGAVLRHAAIFHLPLDAVDDYGRTPLMEMVRRRSLPGVDALLAAGAALDAADRAGSTALHHALWLGEEEIARRLLVAGADFLRRDRDGWDALAVASRTGSTPLVNELLARGAPPHATTRGGWTALALAELEGHSGVAAALRATLVAQ